MTKLEQADEIDWIETNKALAKEIIEMKKQAEQEPVACIIHTEEGDYIDWSSKGYCFYTGETPLYAAHVRTKDLTDDEIWKVIDAVNPSAHIEDLNPLSLCRAVIAADREKNK